MIRIEISGTPGSGTAKLAAKLHNVLALDGKIVRLYDVGSMKGSLPDPLPTDCNIVIIVKKEMP